MAHAIFSPTQQVKNSVLDFKIILNYFLFSLASSLVETEWVLDQHVRVLPRHDQPDHLHNLQCQLQKGVQKIPLLQQRLHSKWIFQKLWVYHPLKFGGMNFVTTFTWKLNLPVHDGVLWVFGKHLFILFHFRFLINILLLTDNAKHELNNVGSLSPERTVLRTDSRVKVLAKDGIRKESLQQGIHGQGIVLSVVCHRCQWRR